MPDLPAPYEMRNWKDVTIKYDQFIYVTPHTGTHFPLIGTRTPFNYPALTPIALDTYVGSPSTTQAEGINILPSIVGASLMGINKANQGGVNWVEKTKDFFNKTNKQNVYLNGSNASSGGDWWYDVMPNIFFYQLYSRYPSIPDYDQQFTSVADRWLTAVQAMGGKATPWTAANMNYRAWNLMTMTGNTNSVVEPEAAGGIGWLLYHAYLETGEKKYLDGAQQSLEFLSGLTVNPSYELQLPYGAFIAAKMNAEQGTSYNVQKILNWCFDRGSLRGWGSIVGSWDGKDVDGLIGEANDMGNDYAFALNGFQQAAALVPLIKYDKRFARDIAKWTLNVANASRFFYRPFPTSQDDFDWSLANDPDAVIAYEALKEKDSHNGDKRLNATGDAKRNGWAATNLGLYGSSSVGYLAAVVDVTDVPGILLLDVNKTDFFLENAYPTYALYNPYTEDKLVTLTLPAGLHDIYDALSEITLKTNVSGTTTITIKTDEAVLLTYVPAGTSLIPVDGELYANDTVIDYHYGFDFTPEVRIKSLAVSNTFVESGKAIPVFLTMENVQAGATYTWHDDQGSEGTFTTPNFTWTSPAINGENTLVVEVVSSGTLVTDSIIFKVVESIPVISSITTNDPWHATGSEVVFTCNVTDSVNPISQFDFEWITSGGSNITQSGATFTWQAPATEGIYSITCKVTDQEELTVEQTITLLVKQTSTGETPALAYYPLDGDVLDYSGNNYNAQMTGADPAADARGISNQAYLFNANSDIILVPNQSTLNFQHTITLSFWVKVSSIPEESFILSHGSYEQRLKVSITPTGRLRWTVKTDDETRDLDSSFPLALNQFYHFAVVYSGYSMELYADGELDNFISHSGLIGMSSKPITFGRKDQAEPSYNLRGVLDEVRIYNAIVPPDEISTLKTKWREVVTGVESDPEKMQVYPNPAEGDFFLSNIALNRIQNVNVFDANGKMQHVDASQQGNTVKISLANRVKGVFILSLQSEGKVYHRKIILK